MVTLTITYTDKTTDTYTFDTMDKAAAEGKRRYEATRGWGADGSKPVDRWDAAEITETEPTNDMTPERAAALIETNTATIAALRDVAIPHLTDPYVVRKARQQIARLERQNAYHRRFTA
jgi:hypothetical protein